MNTFPGLVHTARHTLGVSFVRSRYSNRLEVDAEVKAGDLGEVVTR